MRYRPFEPNTPQHRPSLPSNAEIRVGENGYIHGIDGMLDQIAGALARHAGPVFQKDILPAVRRDVELQERIGAIVGDEIASRLSPWLFIGAGALATIAVVEILRWNAER
jgi:hypothetical protein